VNGLLAMYLHKSSLKSKALYEINPFTFSFNRHGVRNNASHRVIWHFSLGNTWHELAAPLWVLICSYSYMRRSFPALRAPCAHTSCASRCARFPALEAPYSASHPEASIHCPPSSLSAYIPISLICVSFHFYFYHGPLLYIPYSVALRLRMTALRRHI